MRPFGEAQSKAMRADQSGQDHMIVESRVRLTLMSMLEYDLVSFISLFYLNLYFLY